MAGLSQVQARTVHELGDVWECMRLARGSHSFEIHLVVP